jgi:hypothetical protein
LGAWVALRVSLLIKVREAEALLSQVKALRVRESTFQDAKRLADQYNGKVEDHWISEDRRGPCTFEDCEFMISLETWPDRQPGLLKAALRFVGIRACGVEGAVGVRDGRVIGTEFGVTTEATPGSIGGNGLLRWPRFPTVFRRATTRGDIDWVLTTIQIERLFIRTLQQPGAVKSYCRK